MGEDVAPQESIHISNLYFRWYCTQQASAFATSYEEEMNIREQRNVRDLSANLVCLEERV